MTFNEWYAAYVRASFITTTLGVATTVSLCKLTIFLMTWEI